MKKKLIEKSNNAESKLEFKNKYGGIADMYKLKNTLFISILLVLLCLGNTVYSAEDYVSFTFRDRDLKDVFSAIGQVAGVNIVTAKGINGKVTLSLKDVYYEKAMELVAKTNGLEVRKEDNTYIIGDPQSLAEGFDQGLNRSWKLKFAKAQEVANIIKGVFKKSKAGSIEVTPDQRLNAVIVTATKEVLDKIGDLIESIDVKVMQVMIEAKIVEVKTKGLRNLGFNWNWGTEGSVNSTSGSGPIMNITESQARRLDANAYSPALSSKGASDIFSFGDFYRGPTMFKATLNALETSGDTKILSNPKIATLNGETAQIHVGDKVIYGGGPSNPPQEKDVGVILKITPRVNEDGWVTAEIEPEVSFVSGKDPSGVYPTIAKRTAKTVVRVKDGEEILIGGLIKETQIESVSKIPVLGDIPVIKTFFQNRSVDKETQELIILITPRVIQQVES